jgi:hypothetical protein
MGVERHGGHVWSVDINAECGALYAGHPAWTFVLADSLDAAAIHAAGVPEQLDVLFVDTLHDYEQVKGELGMWGSCVRPGGCILVHDTDTFPGAQQAVREWAAGQRLPVHFRAESNGLAVVNIPPPPARVAAIIPNRNMPEAVDALVERIARTAVPLDVIVVDDASQRPSKYTTLALRLQVRPNRARLMGLAYAEQLAAVYGVPYYAYWLLTTSVRFADDNPPDILAELLGFLQATEDAACVLPAYTPDSRAPWLPLLGDRGSGGPRRVWFVEWTAALLRADWFDGIGWLDPENGLGWGTEYEPALWARAEGRAFYVHEGVRVVKDAVIAHEMGRRQRSLDEYWQDAGREMERIMSGRYGPGWRAVMEAGREGLD